MSMDDSKIRKMNLGFKASKALSESEEFLIQELHLTFKAMVTAFNSDCSNDTLRRIVGKLCTLDENLVKLNKHVVEGNRLTKEMLDNAESR